MSGEHPTHSGPRARPVAGVPLDALLARAEDLARRWAIALILARPLGRLGDIPLADLACEAPALCAQAVRALESDVELDRLTGGGPPSGREDSAPARRLAAMAGAQDAGEAVQAVEALRSVLWETLLEELPAPTFERAPRRQVADLADRLAYVCASALVVTIAATVALDSDAPPEPEVVVASSGSHGAHDGDPRAASGSEAVIVDEHAESYISKSGVGSEPTPGRGATRLPGRPLSWDESPPVPPRTQDGEIEIRDERGEQGPSAWTRSIGRQLERFGQDGVPFAVLLVEILEIDRLRRDEPPGVLERVVDQVHEALAAEMRGASGSLTQESPGRYWLLAPKADRGETERLADRLARAVQFSRDERGYALEVLIGTAVCPQDGREAAVLAAHADVGLYAARSAARAAVSRPAAAVDEPT